MSLTFAAPSLTPTPCLCLVMRPSCRRSRARAVKLSCSILSRTSNPSEPTPESSQNHEREFGGSLGWTASRLFERQLRHSLVALHHRSQTHRAALSGLDHVHVLRWWRRGRADAPQSAG